MLVFQPMPSGNVLLFFLIFNSHGSSPSLKMMLGYDLPINQRTFLYQGMNQVVSYSSFLSSNHGSNINDLCAHFVAEQRKHDLYSLYTPTLPIRISLLHYLFCRQSPILIRISRLVLNFTTKQLAAGDVPATNSITQHPQTASSCLYLHRCGIYTLILMLRVEKCWIYWNFFFKDVNLFKCESSFAPSFNFQKRIRKNKNR